MKETVKHRISKDYDLGVEYLQSRRIRLVILKGEEEQVCRKERVTVIKKFLQSDELSIFKGNLVLEKSHSDILIWVKKEMIGEVEVKTFEEL